MLRPKAINVKPFENYNLILDFDNGEKRLFDCMPYISGDWFSQLKDPCYFKTVHIAGLTVEWANGQDICPDCLYNNSIPIIK